MRIAHTPPRYAPYIGGVEAVDQVVAQWSHAHGDEVFVIAPDDPRGAPEVINGIPVKRLRKWRKVANTNVTWGLPKALWHNDFDVVHTHLPTPWTADISVLIAALKRRRSIVHFHNPIVGDGLNGTIAALYRRTLQRLTLRLTDGVIVISETRRQLLLSQHPRIAHKLHLVPNGVDLERFQPGPFDVRNADLLFVSVLDDFHDYKGLSVLLEALVAAPEGILRVVGDGPKRAVWEQEAIRLGLGDRVIWEGAVDNARLLYLYRSCGIFVLPSRTADHEGGSSLVALEAMSCGLPVILADGVGDLAGQAASVGAGVRVTSNDVIELQAALQSLLNSVDQRETMGKTARAHVESHHSWDVACRMITDLYRT